MGLVGKSRSLYMDGAISEAKTGATSLFNKFNGQELTVSVWFKPNRLGGRYQDLVTCRTATIHSWILYSHISDGSIQMHGAAQNKSTYIPPLDKWTHIAVTITAAGLCTLYANGQIVQQFSGFTYGGYSPNILCVGSLPGGEWIQGNFKNVSVRNVAITQGQVQSEMNTGLVGNEAGLIGYWKFEEGTGLTAFDATPNVNNLTLTTAYWSNDAPTAGTNYFLIQDGTEVKTIFPFPTLQFDGVSDYASVPSNADNRITGNQKIEMWLKPQNRIRSNPYEKSYGGEGTITYEVDGTLNYYWGTAGTDAAPYQGFNSATVLPLNSWTHIALVRNLTTMMLYWYYNGVLVNSVAASYASAVASTNPIRIGTGYAGSFMGSIFDLRIWNVAHTQAQILTYMGRYLDGSESGLKGNWRLYEGSDEVSYDVLANDATIFNGATWLGASSPVKQIMNVGFAPVEEFWFTDLGFTDLSIVYNSDLAQLTSASPVLLNYTTDVGTERKTALSVTPKDGSIVLNNNGGDIITTDFTAINSFTLAYAAGAADFIRIVASVDTGVVWKAWNGSAWVNVSIGPAVKTNGMAPTTFNALTAANWASLRALGTLNKIRFGYYLESATSVSPYVDTLSVNVNMSGQWANALEGTDYRYGYARTNEIRVRLYTDGNYKFNY